MEVHQSQLSSWARCPEAVRLEGLGYKRKQLSPTAYGSVIHWAILNVFEQARAAGDSAETAKKAAVESFKYYWQPDRIESITEPVDEWLPRSSHSELLERGIAAIEWFCGWAAQDLASLLATEYSFSVEIPGTIDDETGEPHVLKGTVDRLSAGYRKRILTLYVDDVKSGKTYWNLRYHPQFSSYGMASLDPSFWTGQHGEEGFGYERGMELFHQFVKAPRFGRWIGLKDSKVYDAGYRGEKDYRRFAHAVNQMCRSIQLDVYPLTLSGDACTHCDQAAHCADIGRPDRDHGAPFSA